MNKKLISSALLITFISSIGKILGLIRESILASYFGASTSTDAFKIAFSIPDIFIAIFGAAIAQIFIPVYSDYLEAKDKRKTQDFLNSIFTLVSLAAFVIVVIGVLNSGSLVNLIAPGFDNETKRSAAIMTIIMFPGAIFMILANLSSAYLQVHEKFFSSSLIWYSYNIGIIFSLVVFGKYGIQVAAYGSLLGLIGMLLIQIPSLLKKGLKISPSIDFKNEGYLIIRKLIIPVIISSAFNQVFLIINRILASRLEEGSISSLDYAGRVGILVNTIIVISFASVIYPQLAKLGSSIPEFTQLLSKTIRVISMIIIPIVTLVFILRSPIIKVLFERGVFSSNNTKTTATILGFFSLSIIGIAYREFLNRAFFALKDTRTPMVNGIATILINIFVNMILIKFLGVYGLALGTSVASIISSLMLFVRLRRKIGSINGSTILDGFLKAVLASIIMGVFIYVIKGTIFQFSGNTIVVLLNIIIISMLGFLVYIGTLYMLNVDEIKFIREKGAFKNILKG